MATFEDSISGNTKEQLITWFDRFSKRLERCEKNFTYVARIGDLVAETKEAVLNRNNEIEFIKQNSFVLEKNLLTRFNLLDERVASIANTARTDLNEKTEALERRVSGNAAELCVAKQNVHDFQERTEENTELLGSLANLNETLDEKLNNAIASHKTLVEKLDNLQKESESRHATMTNWCTTMNKKVDEQSGDQFCEALKQLDDFQNDNQNQIDKLITRARNDLEEQMDELRIRFKELENQVGVMKLSLDDCKCKLEDSPGRNSTMHESDKSLALPEPVGGDRAPHKSVSLNNASPECAEKTCPSLEVSVEQNLDIILNEGVVQEQTTPDTFLTNESKEVDSDVAEKSLLVQKLLKDVEGNKKDIKDIQDRNRIINKQSKDHQNEAKQINEIEKKVRRVQDDLKDVVQKNRDFQTEIKTQRSKVTQFDKKLHLEINDISALLKSRIKDLRDKELMDVQQGLSRIDIDMRAEIANINKKISDCQRDIKSFLRTRGNNYGDPTTKECIEMIVSCQSIAFANKKELYDLRNELKTSKEKCKCDIDELNKIAIELKDATEKNMANIKSEEVSVKNETNDLLRAKMKEEDVILKTEMKQQQDRLETEMKHTHDQLKIKLETEIKQKLDQLKGELETETTQKLVQLKVEMKMEYDMLETKLKQEHAQLEIELKQKHDQHETMMKDIQENVGKNEDAINEQMRLSNNKSDVVESDGLNFNEDLGQLEERLMKETEEIKLGKTLSVEKDLNGGVVAQLLRRILSLKDDVKHLKEKENDKTGQIETLRERLAAIVEEMSVTKMEQKHDQMRIDTKIEQDRNQIETLRERLTSMDEEMRERGSDFVMPELTTADRGEETMVDH